MDFRRHFERSWQLFTRFLPQLLLSTLVLVVAGFFSLGLLAPVPTAGYLQSLLEALRQGRPPMVKDLFSRMDLFLPLLAVALLSSLVVFFGLTLLVLPGLVLGLVLLFCGLYLTLLMTDCGLPLGAALRQSTRMALQEPISDQLVVVAVYFALSSIGSSLGLGWLLSLPYASLFVCSVYQDKVVRLLREPDQVTPPPPPGS